MREKPRQQMRIWAMLCHLSALLAWILLILLVVIGIPLYLPFNIVAPLMIWQYKKAKNPWIDFQGKESLNFQITLTVYALIIILISLVIVFTGFGMAVVTNGKGNQVEMILQTLVTGWISLTILMLISQMIVVTFATIKAYNGEYYRYPFTIRVLR